MECNSSQLSGAEDEKFMKSYPYLHHFNINKQDLEVQPPQKRGCFKDITNGLLYEIRQVHGSDKACTCVNSLNFLGNENFIKCDQEALRKKVAEIFRKARDVKNRNNLKINKEFMDRVFLPPVCKEERQLGVLTGVQAEVARDLVTKAKSVVQQSHVYKQRIDDLEDEVGELSAYVQVMEEKVAMSLNMCTDITDKHRETVRCYQNDIPAMEREIKVLEEKH